MVRTESEIGDKGQRIDIATKKLKSLLKKQNVSPNKLKAADGVVQRVAFMQITLEDLEADINENGTTEWFSQTEGIEYERERPASAIYNRMIKNYTSACKQLLDMLPVDKSAVGAMAPDEKELLDMMKSGRR